jgi:hypothetical protein
MGTIWTNGVVSLTSDFIFGVSVMTETGWVPMSSLDPEDQDMVKRLVDNNPSCPFKL